MLFEEFDENGDGVLDLDEFTLYLTSVFEALRDTPAFKATGATPAQMAGATAEQCFIEADENADGELTFAEFQNWYAADPMGSKGRAAAAEEEQDPEFEPLPAASQALAPARPSAAVSLFGAAEPVAPLPPPPVQAARSPSSLVRAAAEPRASPAASHAPSPYSPAAAVSDRATAAAVAEVRVRMREILQDEVADLTLRHGAEVAQLQREVEELRRARASELEAARRDFEAHRLEASRAFALERQRLQRSLELQDQSAEAAKLEFARQQRALADRAEAQTENAVRAAVASVQASLQGTVASLQSEVERAADRARAVAAAQAAMHDQLVEAKGNIRVVCRLRPAVGRGTVAATRAGPYEVGLTNKTTAASYAFDQVLGPAAGQEHAFAVVAPLVKSCLHGRDVCLLAYGQTGSGKTHTLVGDLPGKGEPLGDGAGVLPRTVAALFAEAADLPTGAAASVFLSVLEVYNEAVRDLLVDPDPADPRAGPPKVDLRVTSGGGVTVPGAMELEVPDAATTLEILAIAGENRATAATDANAHSSRSHLVVTLRVEVRSGGATGGAPPSSTKLQVVDLAGCERTKGTSTGRRLTEATAINKSLSALGDVVGALCGRGTSAQTLGLAPGTANKAAGGGGKKAGAAAGAAGVFIPYRNSKLTLLLQDALRPHGQAKVVLFACAAPELAHWNETASALTFASRCRAVDLYGAPGGAGGGKTAVPSHKAAAGAAATEAELAAANAKINKLSQKLMQVKA